MPKLIDLFAGVGGMSLGAAKAGFQIAAAVELDSIIIDAHKLNFPNTRHIRDDVGTLSGKSLLESAELNQGELDGLIGGPPCQGFSPMGKRNLYDPRNELFHHFFRLVKETEPNFFVAENVPGILSNKYSGIVSQAQSLVSKRYNLLEPIVVHANQHGAATTRTRVFFIGYRKRRGWKVFETDFRAPERIEYTCVRDALEGLPIDIPIDFSHEANGGWRRIEPPRPRTYASRLSNTVPDGIGNQESLQRYFELNEVSGCIATRHSDAVAQRYGELRPGTQDSISKSFRLDLDGLCPTLRAGTGRDKGSFQAVRPIHPVSPRVITPREAARLQGFPDWFLFHNTKWHSFRQIGNSVSPVMSRAVLSVIMERLY